MSRIKSPASSAKKLMEFREQLKRHYSTIRRNDGKIYPKPSPDQFAMNIRYLVENIEAEEKLAHETIMKGAA